MLSSRSRRLTLAALLLVGTSAAAGAEPDPSAIALAERTMEAMGGRAAYESARLARFDFAVERGGEEVARFHHWWDRHTGAYRLEGTTPEGEPFRVLFDVDTREGEAWIGPRRLAGEEERALLETAYGRFVNDSYWLLMPWKWLDPGVRLAKVGAREHDGRTFQVVELTFGDGVGLTSNDRYRGWVAEDTGLMERWEYVLQDEEGNPGEGEPRAWAWEEWRETPSGVRLSTVKRREGAEPPTTIHFPVATLVKEVAEDQLAAIFSPTGPVGPPAGASGDPPQARGAASALIVLEKAAHQAALHDPATGEVWRRIPTGAGPHEVAVSPDGRRAYVADYGGPRPGNTLTVIDVPSGEKVATASLGAHRRPHGIEVDRQGRIWVTTEGSRAILRLDPETLEIERAYGTQQDGTHMLALAPDEKRVYATNLGSGTVTVIDVATGEARHRATGGGAEGLAVSPDGKELWVAHREDDTLMVLDPVSLEPRATLPTARFPIRVAITPDGSKVLVSCAVGNVLQVFDRAERREIARLQLAAAPIGIEVAPDGSRAWIANTEADALTVVDLARLEVVGRVPTGDEPDGMALARWSEPAE